MQAGFEEVAEALVAVGIDIIVPLFQPRQVLFTASRGIMRTGGQPSCSIASARCAATAWQSSTAFQPAQPTSKDGPLSRLSTSVGIRWMGISPPPDDDMLIVQR